MASAKIQNTSSVTVPFGTIYWKQSLNMRRQLGDTKVLRASLAERGWVEQNPIVVYVPSDSKEWEQHKAECLAERAERWRLLREASNPEAKTELAVFEKLYVSQKTGKLIEPRVMGNAGFRRASAYEAAMIDRFRDTEIPDENKVLDQVPVIERKYSGLAELIMDQQLENELQGLGTEKVDPLDKLTVVEVLYDQGVIENEIRKLYKSTMGQKLFGLVKIDRFFPNLKVLERLRLPKNHADWIEFGPVRHDALVKYNARAEADRKREAGKPLSPKEAGSSPLSEEEVANYFRDLKSGQGNASKIMSKDQISAVANQNKVNLFRKAMEAVLENKPTALATYVQHAEALNLLQSMIDTGKGTVALIALRLADTNPALVHVIESHKDKVTVDALQHIVKPPVPAPVKPQNGQTAPASAPASAPVAKS